MDLSSLPEGNKQRTGPLFTVRSANSPSYSLSRRPGVKKTTGLSTRDDGEGTERRRINGANEESQAWSQSCSSVKGQGEERETSGYDSSSKLNQNGTGHKMISASDRSENPALESRGRTQWRGYDLSSRSKSLDWRTRVRSPDRRGGAGGGGDVKDQPGGSDERRSGVEAARGRTSSLQVYNSTGTSGAAPETSQTPESLKSPKLDQSNWGRSLPSKFRSSSSSSSSSIGAKGGQSIMERIERLYGSAGFSKTEDYNKINTTTTDAPTSPQHRVSVPVGGTFPRCFSSGDKNADPVHSRKSVTWTDASGSNSSAEKSRTFTRGQRPGQSQEDGGVSWSGGLVDDGTRSLDRARSRNTIAARIRSARAAAGIHASPDCKDQNQRETEGKHETKSGSADEDVFESSFKRKKPLQTMTASVRNKINQFEALSMRSQSQVLMHRRTFSVPTQLNRDHDGVKKSGSARAILQTRDEEVTGRKLLPGRSSSVDEVGLGKERERSGRLEKEQTGSDEDFGKYSRLKTMMEIPLNGGAQRRRWNFYIDEPDCAKLSSPDEAKEKHVTSESKSPAPEVTTTEITTTEVTTTEVKTPEVTTPVSDNDKTPTNTPDNSPFLSPQTQRSDVTDAKQTPVQDSTSTSSSTPLPRPLATSSYIDLPDFVSPDVTGASSWRGRKQVLDLNAWVAGLNADIKVWNNEEDDDDDDDDQSTQKDEDSNYDSDSGESSVTITSNMSQSDRRSFCVSLSDLCNFAGVDYESENDSDEWQPAGRRSASLSSDVSALSCVSVMPSEELDRLLEDVRGLGDDALQDYDDVQVAVLHKDVGVGLGFSLAGGVDQNKPITVHKVFHSGVAAQQGSIQEGDRVLSINGTALCGYAHWEALRVLRRAKTRDMGVVVLRRGDVSEVSNHGAKTTSQGPIQTPSTETGELVCVSLEKKSRDLGFSLEGGVGSSLGNRPLMVQKIFQGGPVDTVRPGDELVEIEGVSVMGMRRLEAWTLMRKLPPGPVNVVLRRNVKHLDT